MKWLFWPFKAWNEFLMVFLCAETTGEIQIRLFSCWDTCIAIYQKNLTSNEKVDGRIRGRWRMRNFPWPLLTTCPSKNSPTKPRTSSRPDDTHCHWGCRGEACIDVIVLHLERSLHAKGGVSAFSWIWENKTVHTDRGFLHYAVASV